MKNLLLVYSILILGNQSINAQCVVPVSCSPSTLTYCCGFGITNVLFNTINNSSNDGVDGYSDFTCIQTTVYAGLSYPISITHDIPTTHNTAVWIDFNNDGILDDITERVLTSPSSLIATGSISIPVTAVLNIPLRMRVSADYDLSPPPTSCSDSEFGQVEDYGVTIVSCPSSTSSFSVTECVSYTVPSADETYTIIGTYPVMDTIPNAAGCDSVMTINVTIMNSATGTDTRTECDSLLWIDGNTYYANNNTATFNIVAGAANLCDSLVTLDLNINNSVTGTDSRVECDSLLWIDGNTYYANNNTATFNIVAGAANMCDSLVTLDLIINSINSLVTQSGALLTANESGATYQWVECPSMTLISGATNQSYIGTANGDYAVVITNNGCSDTSACYTVSGVGIIENDFGDRLLLYPNPTDGNFSIDLGNNYQIVTVTLSDLTGKLIQSIRYHESQLLNLKLEEPAGVYLLKIETANRKAVIRLVKE
jgi:hypothetical protein